MDTGFLSTFIASFVTMFIVIDPIMVAPLFAALTHGDDNKTQAKIAIQAAGIAAAVILAFGFFGGVILKHLGIDIAAFRAAGGILLFLIGFRMFFEPDSEMEAKRPGPKASSRDNVAFFPLAIPMLAGPGAIATIMLLMNPGHELPVSEQWTIKGAVILATIVTLGIGIVIMMFSSKIANALGRTGMNTISRLLGMLLMALAVQYVFDGVRVGVLERVGLVTVAGINH
ncbi:MarC family protein [Parvularcula sp. LCG005]|uniref:MarC family protein n=1 Tax=Parvularcula sp. LCG005 TaxID=3078805 RepID=UPI002942C186|nr:MarC family protein [Parvularcula sp. LCG005]WOI54501.1 MarC family protein [Parvularcula sp. LCG005]